MSETRTVSPTLEERLAGVLGVLSWQAASRNWTPGGQSTGTDGWPTDAALLGEARKLLAAAKEHGLVIGEGELDAAWREAEEALPEGGELFLSSDVLNPPERRYEVEAAARILKEGPTADDWKFSANFQAQGADGPTPAAALQALAAKLRDSRR